MLFLNNARDIPGLPPTKRIVEVVTNNPDRKDNGTHFVGVFCPVGAKSGGFVNFPCWLFYQKKPKIELGHQPYFIIYQEPFGDRWMVADGTGVAAYIARGEVSAIGADDEPGDLVPLVYSAWRHDCVEYQHKEYKGFIDGGRDYVRLGSYDGFSKPHVYRVYLADNGYDLVPKKVYEGSVSMKL